MENTNNIIKKCMKKDKKIQILLSTYNGESYLREQLDSFVGLNNYKNVKVLIRDDGSTDKTIDILKEYNKKYGFKYICGKNVGVNKSIYRLLKYCDLSCDYYAVSDQDDVWYKNKFDITLEKLSECNEKTPTLFASCSSITDSDLNVIGKTIIPKKGVTFYNAMIQNVCPGHTQVFNKKLLLELRNNYSDEISVIDHWIYLYTSAFGKVMFTYDCTVYHRQHTNNSVGYQTNFIKKTIARIKRLNFKAADNSTVQLKYFYDLYKNKLNKEYQTEVENFLNSKSFLKRLKYSLTTKTYRQNTIDSLCFRILFLMGKYHL